ncbi:hypothetical protein [Anatilimnocola floriformis]|uniref:hypothetical protein n=1 Tax=Anatilimnocola floriformis TaxID=2948575 RepID=UPI0020C4714B|nr:hypothetical protein [Anatilimnocola floriformis]
MIAQLDDDPGPKKWIHHNSHVTAAALCDALYYGSDRVHLFEDCEHLYKDKIAAGLLRSACAATCGKIRLVTYETKRKLYRFAFDGGIIIVSNESLAIQVERRDERLDRERLIARQCFDSGNDTIERLAKWNAATGKGKQAFYDRLKEINADA